MPYNSRVCVVGAGPAGSALTYGLGKRGIPVTLFEAGPENPQVAGKSFALLIIPEGLKALNTLGLKEALMKTHALSLPGEKIHMPNELGGSFVLHYTPHSTPFMHTLSRVALTRGLRAQLPSVPEVTTCYNTKVAQLTEQGVLLEDGTEHRFPIVFVAEGANSSIRQAHTEERCTKYRCVYFESRLSPHPSLENDSLESHFFHFFPGIPHGINVISVVIPIMEKGRCVFSVAVFGEKPLLTRALESKQNYEQFFREHLPELAQKGHIDFEPNMPLSHLYYGLFRQWVIKKKETTAVLLGDAAHPGLPFAGLYANFSLVDAVDIVSRVSPDINWNTLAHSFASKDKKEDAKGALYATLESEKEIFSSFADPIEAPLLDFFSTRYPKKIRQHAYRFATQGAFRVHHTSALKQNEFFKAVKLFIKNNCDKVQYEDPHVLRETLNLLHSPSDNSFSEELRITFKKLMDEHLRALPDMNFVP